MTFCTEDILLGVVPKRLLLQERLAGGPGDGNECPGRRHGGGEIWHGRGAGDIGEREGADWWGEIGVFRFCSRCGLRCSDKADKREPRCRLWWPNRATSLRDP